MGCAASKPNCAGEQGAKADTSRGAPGSTLLQSQGEASAAAAPKQAKICQEAIAFKETEGDEEEEQAPMAVSRSRDRKGTPWIKKGDGQPLDDEEDDEEEAAPKRATICEDAIKVEEVRDDSGESMSVKRSRDRKSTPWIKPGDATPLADDDDEDEEPEVAGPKRATICEQAIEFKDSAEENATGEESVTVKRSRARKSTPWIKPGAGKPLDEEEEEEEDEEPEVAGPKRATIDQQAIKMKEDAEDGEADEGSATVKRKGARKSTPWIKPGGFTPHDEEDEDESEDEDQGEDEAGSKRATIDQQAIKFKEDGDEDVTVTRSRARKSTPWIKPGAATPHDDEEEDEDQQAAAPKRVSICEEANDVKEIPQSAATTRKLQRKSTPFVSKGAAGSLDDDDEEESDDEAGQDERRATIAEVTSDESATEVDPEVVERCRKRKATPWVKPADVKLVAPQTDSFWFFSGCCSQNRRSGEEEEDIFDHDEPDGKVQA